MPPKRSRNGATPARDLTSPPAPTPSRSSRRVADKVKTQQAIRPFVPAKQSYAYGSPGRMAMPGRLDNKLGAQSAAQVLKKAVDVSQARPAPEPMANVEESEKEEEAEEENASGVQENERENGVPLVDEEDEDEDDDTEDDEEAELTGASDEEVNEADVEEDEDPISPRTRTHPSTRSRPQATPSFRVEQPLAGDFQSQARTPALFQRREPALQGPRLPTRFFAWIRELDPRDRLPEGRLVVENTRQLLQRIVHFLQEALGSSWEQLKLVLCIGLAVFAISEGLPYITDSISQIPSMLPTWNYSGMHTQGSVSTAHFHHTYTQTETRTLTVEASVQPDLLEKVSRLESSVSSLEAVQTRLLSNPASPSSRSVYKVNYFAVGSGMVVDPYLTSPTHSMSNKITDKDTGLVAWASSLWKRPQKPFSPAVAFSPWDDIGECWCAAESEGRAQIGVILSQEIYPTEIVVEHISRHATPDIENAPRDMEVWVQILDGYYRTKAAALSMDSFRDYHLQETAAETSALDDTWIRIAAFQYEIDGASNVQPFKMNVNLAEVGVPVDRVVIRSRSAWGSKFVCIYRLKLHGIPKPAEKPQATSGPSSVIGTDL